MAVANAWRVTRPELDALMASGQVSHEQAVAAMLWTIDPRESLRSLFAAESGTPLRQTVGNRSRVVVSTAAQLAAQGGLVEPPALDLPDTTGW